MGLTPRPFPTPPRPFRRRCATATVRGSRVQIPPSRLGLTRSTVGNCAGGALCFNKRWRRLWWVSVRASDLGSPAVNEQLDSRDETGIVRREKQRDLRHFLGFPHATHRDGGYHPRNHLS